jgi:murein DD-endopeptidase MepM/ murein hydrolase activator NlpD
MNKLCLLACICCLPLRHIELTSPFGYRIHPITGKYTFHAGIDLRAHDDTVFAVLAGKVEAAGYNPLLGIYIRLAHGDFESTYGHLSQLFVMPGDSVAPGGILGISGATGRVTGGHLHFSVQYHHAYINPLKFLLAIENNLNNNNKETTK